MEALGERKFRDIVGILPQPGHLRDKAKNPGLSRPFRDGWQLCISYTETFALLAGPSEECRGQITTRATPSRGSSNAEVRIWIGNVDNDVDSFSQRFHGAKMADLEKKGLSEGREFSV